MMNTGGSTASPGTTSRRWTGRRIGSILTGTLLGLGGLGALAIGATVLGQADDGEVDLGQAQIHSDGHTVVSGALDWSAESYLGMGIEDVRFEVSAAEAGTPMLLALADPAQLDDHLPAEGVVVDRGFRFDYTEYDSAASDLDAVDIWSARADGTGHAELAFDAAAQSGERVLVLTSLDARALDADVASYGSVPGITTIGAAILIAGAMAVAAGGVLVVVPARRARRAASTIAD